MGVITITDGVGDELPHQGPVNHQLLQLWPWKAYGHKHTRTEQELKWEINKQAHNYIAVGFNREKQYINSDNYNNTH